MRSYASAVLAALSLAWIAAGPHTARAQSWDDLGPASPTQAGSTSVQSADASAVSGPTVFVVDKALHLATINLGTKAVHIIGTLPERLTDIAFDPANHQLYGITFKAFYSVNKTTAATTRIGGLGVNDANALVFDSHANAYSAGVNTGELYAVDPSTGRVSIIGPTLGYKSAGDLTFYNDVLILSGFPSRDGLTPTTPNYLVTLNAKTGEHKGTPILLPVFECFGIVSTGKSELYGFCLDGKDAGLYQLFPAQRTVAKRAVLIEDLSTHGLAQILGAAYDGNYQP